MYVCIANPETKVGKAVRGVVLVGTGLLALAACSSNNGSAATSPTAPVTAPATTGTATEQPGNASTVAITPQEPTTTAQQPTGANTDNGYAINDPNNPAYADCPELQYNLQGLNDTIAHGGQDNGYTGSPLVKITKVIYPDTLPVDVALGYQWNIVVQTEDGEFSGPSGQC